MEEKITTTAIDLKNVLTELLKENKSEVETKLNELQNSINTISSEIETKSIDLIKEQIAKHTAPAFLKGGESMQEDPLFWGKAVWLKAKAFNENSSFKDVLESEATRSYKHFGRIKDSINASAAADGGSLLIQTYDNEIIPPLQPNSVVRAAGASVISTKTGVHNFRKVDSMPNAYWIGEGETITGQKPNTSLIKASVKKLANLVPVSNSWLKIAEQSVFNEIQNQLLINMQGIEDDAFLEGSGTEFKPKGILNWIHADNSNNMTATPTAITKRYDLTRLISLVEGANIQIVKGGWIMHPTVLWGLIGTGSAVNGDDVEFFRNIANTKSIYGYPIYTSTNCTASKVYFGDFNKVKILQSSNIEIAMSKEVYFASDETAIRLINEVDLIVTHDKAFAVCEAISGW